MVGCSAPPLSQADIAQMKPEQVASSFCEMAKDGLELEQAKPFLTAEHYEKLQKIESHELDELRDYFETVDCGVAGVRQIKKTLYKVKLNGMHKELKVRVQDYGYSVHFTG